MGNIAIIPARGGSKRLPRKNVLPLGGLPLIAWVIKACLESKVFDHVVVSTEDQEIAEISKIYGASVHARADTLARDTSKVVEVCSDVLKSIDCDTFCCIYATAALLKADTIKDSYEIFKQSEDSNCLMGVSEYNYSPVQALMVGDNNTASLLMPKYKETQSQCYPKIRVSNGTFYWARKLSFLESQTFYCKSLAVYDVDDAEVCDIDTMKDYNEMLKKIGETSISY